MDWILGLDTWILGLNTQLGYSTGILGLATWLGWAGDIEIYWKTYTGIGGCTTQLPTSNDFLNDIAS